MRRVTAAAVVGFQLVVAGVVASWLLRPDADVAGPVVAEPVVAAPVVAEPVVAAPVRDAAARGERAAPKVHPRAAAPAVVDVPAPPVSAPPDATGDRGIPSCDVAGTVRSASGVVVAGARVEIRDRMGRLVASTVTSADGAYRIPDVPLGKRTLVVVPHVAGGRATLGATATPGGSGAPTDVVVPDGVVVTGRVVGPDGTAVPDADIRWYRTSHRETLRSAPVLATTDAYGCFEAPVPTGGTTYLFADPTTRAAEGLRWYYGVAEVRGEPGPAVEIVCGSCFRVEGRVTDTLGRPAAGTRLRFVAESAGFETVATVRADGSVRCGGLPDGGLPVRVVAESDVPEFQGLVVHPAFVTPSQRGPVEFMLRRPGDRDRADER